MMHRTICLITLAVTIQISGCTTATSDMPDVAAPSVDTDNADLGRSCTSYQPCSQPLCLLGEPCPYFECLDEQCVESEEHAPSCRTTGDCPQLFSCPGEPCPYYECRGGQCMQREEPKPECSTDADCGPHCLPDGPCIPYECIDGLCVDADPP